jgi:tetratricopeptide (TPR) repeat protein
MDWLEEMMQDKDVETLSEMLQTPTSLCPETPKSSNRKRHCRSLNNDDREKCHEDVMDLPKSSCYSPPTVERKREPTLFPAAAVVVTPSKSTIATSMTPPRPSTRRSSTSKSPPKSSPFYRKSIQMGNRWNAKGLKKAKSGLWQDALLCWDTALDIRIQVLGHQHLDVANTYNNRGIIALGKKCLWEAAIHSLIQALEIRKQTLGQQHPQVAATMHNLANVHHQAGDLQGAHGLLGHCKSIYLLRISQTKQYPLVPNLKSQQQLARACVAMGLLGCRDSS